MAIARSMLIRTAIVPAPGLIPQRFTHNIPGPLEKWVSQWAYRIQALSYPTLPKPRGPLKSVEIQHTERRILSNIFLRFRLVC